MIYGSRANQENQYSGERIVRIEGKIVLVTGASSGIGEATAKAMASAGAREVLLLARREKELRRVAGEIEARGGKARVYPVDLSKPEAVSAVAAQILKDTGAPDIMINNAGIGMWKFLDEQTPQDIYAEMALPYFAAAWLINAFLPAMRERNSGFILNVGTAGSRLVWPGATSYIAARWALRGLTEALRVDLRGTKIRLCHYESAVVNTPAWALYPHARSRVPKISKIIPDMSTDDAANVIVAAVKGDKKSTVAPFMLKVIYFFHAIWPWSVRMSLALTGARR